MRRPKDTKNPKSGSGQEPPRPGGRARERLDQFNRQRGLPDDAPGAEEGRADDPPTPPGRDKPDQP